MPPFAVALYHTDPVTGRFILHAMPVMIVVLCVLAIAYRYYSAFLAAKVAALDDSRVTPAHRFNDGQNYHPTNKWVLFGHHFAAISGAEAGVLTSAHYAGLAATQLAALTTTSTGRGVASTATRALGSGTAITWLATMSVVWANHQAASWFSTCPLWGTVPITRSKALMRSVLTTRRRSCKS